MRLCIPIIAECSCSKFVSPAPSHLDAWYTEPRFGICCHVHWTHWVCPSAWRTNHSSYRTHVSKHCVWCMTFSFFWFVTSTGLSAAWEVLPKPGACTALTPELRGIDRLFTWLQSILCGLTGFEIMNICSSATECNVHTQEHYVCISCNCWVCTSAH